MRTACCSNQWSFAEDLVLQVIARRFIVAGVVSEQQLQADCHSSCKQIVTMLQYLQSGTELPLSVIITDSHN